MGCCASKKDMRNGGEAAAVDEDAINSRVEEIFTAHDKSKKGYFTKDEFKVIVRDMLNKGGTPVREEYLEKLVTGVDTNNNGNIEKKELTDFYRKLITNKSSLPKGQ
jgi:Ca2+-binding EF-hand superfamily protein